jgi:hypothetical protein
METTKWLKQTVPGFDTLSVKERKAIKDFALLWSLFEGTILRTYADAASIIRETEALGTRKKLDLAPFKPAITHFRQRYHDGRDFTPAFGALNFRNNDCRPIAAAFVDQSAVDEAAILSGLLIIVLRLRNNLFHGVKWAYGIQGQFDNFRHANAALIAIMEAHR